MPEDILRIHLGYHQGNLRIHSPGTAVVNDDNSLLCSDGSKFPADFRSGGKECNVNVLSVKTCLGQLFHGKLPPHERTFFPCGTGGRKQVIVFDRQFSFLKHL